MTCFLVGVIILGTSAALLHYNVAHASELITIDKQERVRHLICKSKGLRDQLDALTREFLDLHHAETEDEVDELTDCILHDVNYEEVLKRIGKVNSDE